MSLNAPTAVYTYGVRVDTATLGAATAKLGITNVAPTALLQAIIEEGQARNAKNKAQRSMADTPKASGSRLRATSDSAAAPPQRAIQFILAETLPPEDAQFADPAIPVWASQYGCGGELGHFPMC